MRIAVFVVALFFLAVDLRAQDAAPADTIAIEWGTDLEGLKPDAPATFVAVCPPSGVVEWTIWGTGTYTSDSSICLAAVHVGALTLADGGAVVVEAAPGLAEYVGSIGNGISSISYPAWQSSFRFPDAPKVATTGGPNEIQFQGNWNTSPRSVGAATGGRIWFVCAAGRSGGNVWGTDVYTDDSSICEAAVHAGVITRADGGRVDLEVLGQQQSFRGSTRNGVSTLDYPAWPGSFRFVANKVGVKP